MPIRQAAFSEDAPALPFVSLRSYLLRRLIAILLLAVFGLPVVSPLFAATQGADAGLPACCRRNGKHHCMMKMEERSKLIQQGVWICPPADKCPYYPGVVPAEHSDLLPTEASGAVPAPITSAPARIVQTESKRRISHDRSRQKRGPPASLLS
jgi:hypothetical protein